MSDAPADHPRSAVARGGMVATAFPAATQIGVDVLQAGGNAIDAAVASAWALSVCEQSGSGLGGQTIALVHLANGDTQILDGHSQAPAAASTETISESQQRTGYRACTLPSTPAVLEELQRRFGRLPAAAVLEPAIALARDGYALTPLQRKQSIWCQKSLAENPSAGELFLDRGQPFEVGHVFRQPALAATLGRVLRCGAVDFYTGQIARDIVEDMQQHGGLITAEDLAEFDPIEKREPLAAKFRNYDLLTSPPPAGGPQVLLGLRLLDALDLDGAEADCRWYEHMAEIVHSVFAHREHVATTSDEDSDWEFPSDETIARLAEGIAAGAHHDLVLGAQEEPGDTTHLCTADADGNVVSLTQSIQTLFGARVANRKLGILYNNYLVTCPRDDHPHRLAPRCQPRSNAAPTLLLEHQGAGEPPRPVLTIGGAGSRRMTSGILQTMAGLFVRNESLATALAAPRVHTKLSRLVWLEHPADTVETLAALEDRFRKVEVRKQHSYAMGCVQAIQFLPDGRMLGAADPRRDGTAAGL